MSGGLERFNALTHPEARAALARCCGSSRWVDEMMRRRPFGSFEEARAAAAAAWAATGPDDWREALHAAAAQRVPPADASTRAAADMALALYRERFGWPFVTDAEELAADELLMLIRIRLGHDELPELRRSRAEHERLTLQRLRSLLAQDVAA